MYKVIFVLFIISVSIVLAMPPVQGLKLPDSDYSEMSEQKVNVFPNPIRNADKKGVVNSLGNVQMLVSGSKKFPIFCVKYPDYNNQYSIDNFQAMLFSDTWSSGSAKKYYQEVSYGNFILQGTCYGWFTADSNRAYYGRTNGFSRAARLAKELAQKADSLINYAEFDNNGDGYVDCFTCLHSGFGYEESGSGADIHSHSWSFTLAGVGEYTTNDPDPNNPGQYIKIDGYVCDPERSNYANIGTMVSIGVFCHEWGHALGLPDLYDTDGGGSGLGAWCLMSTGSWGGNNASPWKPSHMCSWAKMDLGWLNPTAIRSNDFYSLPDVENNAKAFWLISRQRTFKEYFLVENRQKKGFDTTLYNSGLLVYHIDDSVIGARRTENKVNAGGVWKHGVGLEQADGLNQLFSTSNRGDAGDPFPGNSNNALFDTITTNPNSKTNYPSSSQLITGCFIRNIPASSQVMSCTLSSGVYGSFTGGPDAGGFRWIDSDTLGSQQYNWIDISNTGTFLGDGDDAIYSITLPFNINFYGTQYNTLWVCTNGWLCFGSNPLTFASANQSIPNTSTPNQAVYAFWDDLNLLASDSAWIKYQVNTGIINQNCVITWKDARINGAIQPAPLQPANQITFQVILYENGKIVMQYKDCAVGDTVYNWGRSATVGIENSTGTVGLQYLYNGIPIGNLLSNERAILFKNINAIEESSFKSNVIDISNINIFPNPMKNQARIRYSLPKESQVNLEIYNSAGVLIHSINNKIQKPGNYQVNWDGYDNNKNQIAKGVYFVILKTDDYKLVNKIIKIE